MPPRPKKKKVLVADDDQVTLQALAAQLQSNGFQVFMAMDAMQTGMMTSRAQRKTQIRSTSDPSNSGTENWPLCLRLSSEFCIN